MPDFIKKILKQLEEFWGSLKGPQRKRIYITTAVTVVVVTVAVILLTRPSYMTLVTNDDSKEMGEMTSILDENNISYKLDNNETSLIINSRDSSKARVALLQSGYPKEGTTFEDAIKLITIGTTEGDKEHIWLEQQTSNLEKMIKLLDNIEEASVNIAIPEKTLFLTSDYEKIEPTAIVSIKPGKSLTSGQIEGIVMMVSRSVENLKPDKVTVVDNNANILNTSYSDNSIEIVSTQEEMRRKKKNELESTVYNFFSVGSYDSFDSIRVSANPYLDFDILKSQSKLLTNPEGMDKGAVISNQTKKEELINGSTSDIPGTDTNPGTSSSYQTGEDDNSSYNNQESLINYDYNETVKEEEKAIGYMVPDKSTIAISFLYGIRVKDENKLSDVFLAQVKQDVSAATGIPASKISTNRYLLSPPEEVKEPFIYKVGEALNDYGFFAVMLVLMFGLLIAMSPLWRKRDDSLVLAGIPVDNENANDVEEIVLSEGSEIKKQIDKFVKQKPEAVAQLLRGWLSEDWD